MYNTTVEEFLKDAKLEIYVPDFQDSGYDDINQLVDIRTDA